MANSVRIDSYPCAVRFAGWESDTFTLQRAGWQIAANEIFEPWNGPGLKSVTLILRHERAKIHAITGPCRLNPHIFDMMRFSSQSDGMREMAKAGFDVIAMGSDVRIQTIAMPKFSFKDFSAVNCEPQTIQEEITSLQDLKIFRPINSDAPEIIIPTHSVSEMMDLVLKLQDPVQKEIRERRRKEKLRGNWQEPGYDAVSDIKCQILAFG